MATQTPKGRSAWALGVLSSGIMAGGVAGPLLGGALPPLIGVRRTFLLAGGVIFVAFLATVLLIRETRPARTAGPRAGAWAQVADRRAVLAMLATGTLLTLANMSIEPIVTLYVAQLMPRGGPVTVMSGLIMAAAALGSVLAAPPVGRIADRIGHRRVVVAGLLACAGLLLPQALVTRAWQLLVLRFLMGAALAGLSPAITSMIRHAVPVSVAGRILSLEHLRPVCRLCRRAGAGRHRRGPCRHAPGVRGYQPADAGRRRRSRRGCGTCHPPDNATIGSTDGAPRLPRRFPEFPAHAAS